MKHISFYLIVLSMCMMLYPHFSKAQTETLYSYDESGNRTLRNTINLHCTTANPAGNNYSADLQRYIEKKNNVEIELFPNPTKGQVNIQASNIEEHSLIKYDIIDTRGTVKVSEKANSSSFMADLSVFPNGIYFIRITIGTVVSTWRIIKD